MQFGRISVVNRKEIQITVASTHMPPLKILQPGEYKSRILGLHYMITGTYNPWNKRDSNANRNKDSHI
jgi:hypothetical protein